MDMEERFCIYYCDNGEYSVPMRFDEAVSCTKLFGVDQYIVDIRTGEIIGGVR